MNTQLVEKYRTYAFKGERKLINHAVDQSLLRVETYKSKQRFPKIRLPKVFQKEIQSNLAECDNLSNIWEDKTSIIARPLDSQIFLSSTAGYPETSFGSTTHSFDTLGRDNYAGSRMRFLYDDYAHENAKTITLFFRTLFLRKVRAAIGIQRVYRGYKTRKRLRICQNNSNLAVLRIRAAIIKYYVRLRCKLSALKAAKSDRQRQLDATHQERVAILIQKMLHKRTLKYETHFCL